MSYGQCHSVDKPSLSTEFGKFLSKFPTLPTAPTTNLSFFPGNLKIITVKTERRFAPIEGEKTSANESAL
jgi:hypothetical protein